MSDLGRGVSRRSPERAATRGILPRLALVGALLTIPTGAVGQESVGEMAASCAGTQPLLTTLCQDAALALVATRAGIGLAASQGSAVPGSASTLGRRMASSPRLSFS